MRKTRQEQKRGQHKVATATECLLRRHLVQRVPHRVWRWSVDRWVNDPFGHTIANKKGCYRLVPPQTRAATIDVHEVVVVVHGEANEGVGHVDALVHSPGLEQFVEHRGLSRLQAHPLQSWGSRAVSVLCTTQKDTHMSAGRVSNASMYMRQRK